jgi:DNA-binding SARP family transcriptional activator
MDSEWIAIAGRPYIDSDLWQLRDHLDEVEAAQRDGDSERAVAHLEEACALWRGEPCSDVAVLPDIAPAVEEVMRSLVDAMLRLGELRLVAGRFDGALAYAQRAVTAAPYSERARRLVIAAQLQRRDREGLQRALLEVDDMLRDLGVDPEPSTQMLMRQAQARIVEPSAPADV